MARRISSPVFVGRKAELATLAATMQEAAEGRGAFLLVAGEAGVGKSRFLEEATRSAREAGWIAAVGRCVDIGVGGTPFAPMRTALRDVLAAAGEAGLESTATDALPLPGSDANAGGAERIGVGRDTSQARTFEACLDLLRAVGGVKPILLVVEDIHWADPSTLDLLGYLAHDLWETRVVLAASFRSDELHRRHPLQPFLGEIQRARSTDRIDLGRFSEDEVAEQVTAILGEPASPELVGRVFKRSDGNAFYAEELVVAGADGVGLPPAMRDVLLARVATLDDRARELLRVVAAGGTRVSSAVVARVAGIEPAELDATLRNAVDRHLLRPLDEEDAADLEFRHALVQEAVYAELLPGERSRLHARYGEVLEADHRPNDATSPELAYHWFAAHDLPRALAASVEAGRYAASSAAFGDAHDHYERALELWDRVTDATERTGLDRIELLELAATTAAVSDPARAAALMLEAVRSEGAGADATRLALLKERQGRYAWLAGDGVTALDACREAADLLTDATPVRVQARVLASLGQILMVTLRVDEAKVVCERAVAAARAAGDPEVEAHALNSLGVTNVYRGEMDTGLDQLRAALDQAIQVDSVEEISRARGNLVDVLGNTGRFEESAEEAIAAFAYAEEHGLVRVDGVTELAEASLALYRLGRWDRAEAMLQQAWRHATTGVSLIMVEERFALLDVGRGRLVSAADRLAAARPLIERVLEAQFVAPLAEAAVELALWRGDPIAARAEVAAVFARLEPIPAYISRLGPLLALGTRAEADASELARARHDAAALSTSAAIARRYRESMQALRDAAAERLPNFLVQAEAWLAQSVAETNRAEGSDDPIAWARCAEAFGAIPMAYPRAYALWREASATLAGSRDRPAATRALVEARRIALELRAVPLRDEIDALARRAHLELDDAQPVAPDPAPADDLGLTQREREVIALLADGRSNREIAETLFITEGTAGTHVSNILGKLGVRGRTEAAAMAYRLGLVD